jgi:glycosyltransferase involved in cell wall biosynthesis
VTETPSIKVALVVPAYNEEKFIEKSINSLEEYLFASPHLKKKYKAFILIAEDGSTDNTLNIIRRLSNKYDNIIIRHSPNKLGRGRAVKEAWRNIDADIYAYLDADMATPISYLDTLFDNCNNNNNNGFDVVTGSRYIEHSYVKRPFLRNRVSKSYNYLINLIFGTSVKDHQCGFKAVTKNACRIICQKSIFDDWFWDTEIFVIARRNGLSVCEFPIKWQEKRGTKTPVKRLLKDISIHSLGIIKLLLNNNNQLKTENSRGTKRKQGRRKEKF